jgi:hypothetical protein
MANTHVIKKCASGFIVEVIGGPRRPPPAALDYDTLSATHAFEHLDPMLDFIKGNYAEEQHRDLLEREYPCDMVVRDDITATEVLKRQMAECRPAAPVQPAPAPVNPHRGPASDR